jgi:hypothetical protein
MTMGSGMPKPIGEISAAVGTRVCQDWHEMVEENSGWKIWVQEEE